MCQNYLYSYISLRPHDRITHFCPTDILVQQFYLHVSLGGYIIIPSQSKILRLNVKGLTISCMKNFNLAIFMFHIYKLEGFNFCISQMCMSGLLVAEAPVLQAEGHDSQFSLHIYTHTPTYRRGCIQQQNSFSLKQVSPFYFTVDFLLAPLKESNSTCEKGCAEYMRHAKRRIFTQI